MCQIFLESQHSQFAFFEVKGGIEVVPKTTPYIKFSLVLC